MRIYLIHKSRWQDASGAWKKRSPGYYELCEEEAQIMLSAKLAKHVGPGDAIMDFENDSEHVEIVEKTEVVDETERDDPWLEQV